MQISAQAERTTRINRTEHDYEPRIPKLAFYRQSTRHEPPELVIVGQNNKQYAWSLTWDQFHNLVQDGSGMYFKSVKPKDGNSI